MAAICVFISVGETQKEALLPGHCISPMSPGLGWPFQEGQAGQTVGQHPLLRRAWGQARKQEGKWWAGGLIGRTRRAEPPPSRCSVEEGRASCLLPYI